MVALWVSSLRLDKPKVQKEDWYNTIRQPNPFTCGYACMRMVLLYHGINADSAAIASTLKLDPETGTSMLNLRSCAESFGFSAIGWKLSYEELADIGMPAIAHLGNVHFVVVDRVGEDGVIVRDPLNGRREISKDDFEDAWTGNLLEIKRTSATSLKF